MNSPAPAAAIAAPPTRPGVCAGSTPLGEADERDRGGEGPRSLDHDVGAEHDAG